MKVLVIPDVHLKPRLFDRAERILRDKRADTAVCLMDIADDWGMGNNIDLYEEAYERAAEFAKARPETRWCYGNHDIQYIWGIPAAGFSPAAKGTVIKKLGELKSALTNPSQLAFIHRLDNVLFSHGGLTAGFVRRLGRQLLKADIDAVLAAVNGAGPRLLWEEDSPLWLRPREFGPEMFGSQAYKQVVGHTPAERIYENNGVIYTDVFSSGFDSEQIGESAMLVIDTLTKAYEIIAVPAALRTLF